MTFFSLSRIIVAIAFLFNISIIAAQDDRKMQMEYDYLDSIAVVCHDSLYLFDFLYVDDLSQHKFYIPFLEKKWRLSKKIYGQNSIEYILSMADVAWASFILGNTRKSIRLYSQCLELGKTVVGEDTPLYAEGETTIADLYFGVGNYDLAEKYFQSALQKLRKVGDSDLKWYEIYIYSLNNFALMYLNIGRYDEAKSLFEESLKGSLEREGVMETDYITTIGNLASLDVCLKNYEEAEKKYKQVIQLERKKYNNEGYKLALSLRNIAELYLERKAWDLAEKNLNEAILLSTKVKGYPIPSCLSDLGLIYERKGAYAKAEQLHKEAIESVYKQVKSKKHPAIASCYQDYAHFLLRQQSYAEAEAVFFEALEANNPINESIDLEKLLLNQCSFFDRNFSFTCFLGLHQLYFSKYTNTNNLQDLEKAASYANIAFREMHTIQQSYLLSQNKKFVLDRGGAELISSSLNTYLALYEQKGAPKYLNAAMSIVSSSKAILLTESTRSSSAILKGKIPKHLHEKANYLSNLKAQLENELKETSSLSKQEFLYAKINDIHLKINLNKEEMIEHCPTCFNNNSDIFDIDKHLAFIQQSMDSASAIVDYYVTDSTTFVFWINHNQSGYHKIAISKKSLEAQIDKFRFCLSNYSYIINEKKKAYEDFKKIAHWFYNKLIYPVYKHIHTKENIVIIPDGMLGLIPFETFISTSPQNNNNNFDQLDYLLTKHNIYYDYTAQLYAERYQQKKSNNNGKLLAIAAEYASEYTNLDVLRTGKTIAKRTSLKNLPDIKIEVEMLQQLFDGSFLYNLDASEKSFRNNVGNFACIHLAMHGIVDLKDPMYSCLAFTENQDKQEDNFLHAFEINNLPLNADLVTLSACETGYGQFQKGEGVISLAHSFLNAGVPATIVSLWQVNDKFTSKLMSEIYKNISKGMTKAAALKNAKLFFVGEASAKKNMHPAFWSPFILIGNNSPIKLEVSKSYRYYYLSAFITVLLIAGVGWMRRKQ